MLTLKHKRMPKRRYCQVQTNGEHRSIAPGRSRGKPSQVRGDGWLFLCVSPRVGSWPETSLGCNREDAITGRGTQPCRSADGNGWRLAGETSVSARRDDNLHRQVQP